MAGDGAYYGGYLWGGMGAIVPPSEEVGGWEIHPNNTLLRLRGEGNSRKPLLQRGMSRNSLLLPYVPLPLLSGKRRGKLNPEGGKGSPSWDIYIVGEGRRCAPFPPSDGLPQSGPIPSPSRESSVVPFILPLFAPSLLPLGKFWLPISF
jgi:hypothetical protein